MTLPLAPHPRLVFYSQTVDGRPFVNCLPYSICPVLRYAGYQVPTNYGMAIRVASGVPVAPHAGTSYADMKRALTKLFPEMMAAKLIIFGKMTDAELLADLPRWGRKNKTKDVMSVTCRMHELPRYLRRLVGYNWVGKHAIGLGGYRLCNGTDGGRHQDHANVAEVWWMDPMGRTTNQYYGQWVPWDEVKDHLGRSADGMVKCVHAQKGTALPAAA